MPGAIRGDAFAVLQLRYIDLMPLILLSTEANEQEYLQF